MQHLQHIKYNKYLEKTYLKWRKTKQFYVKKTFITWRKHLLRGEHIYYMEKTLIMLWKHVYSTKTFLKRIIIY